LINIGFIKTLIKRYKRSRRFKEKINGKNKAVAGSGFNNSKEHFKGLCDLLYHGGNIYNLCNILEG
jgi:hypothetical protein